MDVRRENIKISLNYDIGVWELRYDKHPKVISYSSNWELLEEWSISIIRQYFEGLKKMVISTETCTTVM